MSRNLKSNIKELLYAEIQKFRENSRAGFDLKHLSVSVPYPYYDLLECVGTNVDCVYFRPNVRNNCANCDWTDLIVLEDSCGGNLGCVEVEFYEKGKGE